MSGSIVWRWLCGLWLSICDFFASLFRKPRQQDEVTPPILPFTRQREAGAAVGVRDAVDHPAVVSDEEQQTSSPSGQSFDETAQTDYDSIASWTQTAQDAPAWMVRSTMCAFDRAFTPPEYPFSVAKDISLHGRISGTSPDLGFVHKVSTPVLLLDSADSARAQARNRRIRQVVADLKRLSQASFDASVFLDSVDDLSTSADSTSMSRSDRRDELLEDSSIMFPTEARPLRAERREILIDFSELGAYPYNALSASSTCVLRDIPSSNTVAGVDCIPLPTTPPMPPVSKTTSGVVEATKSKGRISLASYPDAFDTTLDSIPPSNSVHALGDSGDAVLPAEEEGHVNFASAVPPASKSTTDCPKDKTPTSLSETTAPGLPPDSSLTPASGASTLPELEDKEKISAALVKGRRKSASPLKPLNIENETKKIDTPDRDRYRGIAYSKPVLHPSLSAISVHAASPPIPLRPLVYVSPNASPTLPSSPSINVKPRTIRIVHDMTLGRSPIPFAREIQRSSALGQENVNSMVNMGNARHRRTSVPPKDSPSSKDVKLNSAKKTTGGNGFIGGHNQKAQSISKTTGCWVQTSTSSPGLTG